MAGPSGKKKGSEKPPAKRKKAKSDKDGRPRIEVDMDLLSKLCQLQCTAVDCAHVLGMSTDTIDRRLKEDGFAGFDQFRAENNSMGRVSLRRVQFQTAMAGNHTMQIWLGKQWLGQTDKVDLPDEGDPDSLVVNFEVREAVGEVRVTRSDDDEA